MAKGEAEAVAKGEAEAAQQAEAEDVGQAAHIQMQCHMPRSHPPTAHPSISEVRMSYES